MRRALRIVGVGCLLALASIAAWLWYDDYTFLARTLHLERRPSSLRVVERYTSSWTDFYADWVVEVDPAEADELLSGRRFERQQVTKPTAVFEFETGAHRPASLARPSRLAKRQLFAVDDGYCIGDWQNEDRICVWRSAARDRALIQRSGD